MMRDMTVKLASMFDVINDRSDHPLVVCHLGNVALLAQRMFPRGRALPLFGSMGMVLPVAVGIAMGCSNKVIAIEGDGGLLMNLGGLTTAATLAPANLLLVVLDNDGYQTTGGQPTGLRSSQGLTSVLSACGWQEVKRVDGVDFRDSLDWGLSAGIKALIVEGVDTSFASGPTDLNPEATARAFAASLDAKA